MSMTKKLLNEKQKLKNMTKAELQQTIIKKKQCDAKALAIVEQLLEPNINPDWFLQNLRFLSKRHMEDIIEERTILKLCGYVLCSKPLTVIIRQQYHISTRSNKVYDISKRKKFCSSSCYAASNYLFEQMLDSPLWLRDKEEIPVFKPIPINFKPTQCASGDEIDIVGNNRSQNITDKESTESRTIKPKKEKLVSCDTSSFKQENAYNVPDDMNIEEDIRETEISVNADAQKLFYCETSSSNLHKNLTNKNCNLQESRNESNKDDNQEINIESESSKVESVRQCGNILHFHQQNIENKSSKTENVTCDKNDKTLQSPVDDADKIDEIKRSRPRLDKICDSVITTSSNSRTEHRKKRDADKINKTRKCKLKESTNVEAPSDVHPNLVAHIEDSLRKWITKDTLCLLLGEEDEKNRLLEKLTQQEKYEKLCKKLNTLQMEDKLRDRASLGIETRKPLPELSVLQEEGKKLKLKVRAFYGGQITYPLSEDSNKESENKVDDDSEPVLPSIERCAPDATRRRIFLDKLDTTLPDLLRTLTSSTNVFSLMEYIYNNEKYSSIKILVSTFNLSAGNIVFKTGEWILVGFIIIKMLSLINAKLQSSLQSKQASMYTSMMLTLYKLDINYLDRIVMEVINDVSAKAYEVNDKD